VEDMLEDLDLGYSDGYATACINLQKQLMKIHNGVRKFQRHLTDVKPTPELIEKLKEIMSEVEISINSVKEEQRSRDLPAEVRALEVFLQKTGGSYGGWDQYDHEAFLKVWVKHSGEPGYRKEAKLYLPGRTMEEIEQHEEWHQELIYLQDRKKEVMTKHEERRRQLEVKLTVEEQLRLRRVEEEEQERRRRAEEEREREERRKEATKSIRRFNERIKLRVGKRLTFCPFFHIQVDNHVNRDPSRLTRPTKGWEERLKHIGPSGDGPMLQMFHRAVPTWRQGL
uniref:Coiled-coil domain containing 112 n=1 Tax=Pundamilia nyererei TaxID=303518 RepID=A0A3B4FVA5_9CICH